MSKSLLDHGPSRQNGPRACRGACPGPGRRRLRREEPTAFGRGDRCPRRRVARCRRWTGDLDPWSLWWTRPQGSPPSRCLRAPGRLFQGAGRVVGAPCACWWPRLTMRPSRTGPVTKAVQRGTPCPEPQIVGVQVGDVLAHRRQSAAPRQNPDHGQAPGRDQGAGAPRADPASRPRPPGPVAGAGATGRLWPMMTWRRDTPGDKDD